MPFLVLPMLALATAAADANQTIDLGNAVVITRGPAASEQERNAARVLIEEVAKRSGVGWKPVEAWPNSAQAKDPPATIVIAASLAGVDWSARIPAELKRGARPRAEGYRLYVERRDGAAPVVWIVGADARGVLFGVGRLLRELAIAPGQVRLSGRLDATAAPVFPLRGHQLGYRGRANSWDAWDERQFEQYIRELALFGANAVENIPFQGADGPHMRRPRRAMNRRLSEICRRYGLEYWLWTPADFDLTLTARRAQALAQHEQLYADCPRIDGVFVPGGDPGDNHPSMVLPFLAELAKRLTKHHAQAKLWLSMQGYNPEKAAYVHGYIEQHRPNWLGGLVHGPSSPSANETRRRLPKEYALRHYPDITHCVRCQYPLPWWDPAFACTLGREPINPTPVYQAQLHRALATPTCGFISYSDGVHDDVNKVVWTQLAWDPARRVVPKPDNIVARERWGSKPDPIPASRKQTPKWITIHHAGVLWTNSQDPAQFVRNLQSWGKKRPQLEKPPRNTYWPDLPYHFLIAPDGRVYEGRPVEFEPESNTAYPLAGNLGVEMMGDFNRQRPSPAQLESAVRLTAWLMQEHRIELAGIRTHRDVAPGQTNCPGRDFYRYMQDGQFKKWLQAVRIGEALKIDPGPPLRGEPPGPTELITDTRPPKKK